MSEVKSRDLARFKKTREGLIEFACILEQAHPKTRERIILDVGQLDPSFLRTVLRKVVFFEELIYLDELVLAEILSQISPKILAFALVDSAPDFSKKVKETLPFRTMKQLSDEQEKMGAPNPSMVFGAQVQILRIARELEAKNKIIFELLDCPRFRTADKQHLRLVTKK